MFTGEVSLGEGYDINETYRVRAAIGDGRGFTGGSKQGTVARGFTEIGRAHV